MQLPVLSILLLIFILWFQYEIHKNKKLGNKDSEKFWQLEQKANQTRRKDISNLEYIEISLDQLPRNDYEDPTLNYYGDTIRKLAGSKILNLAGKTNTELKLQYGAANFNHLLECDKNYITLVSFLHKWGERFYSLGYITEAVTVLEYAVSCLTDVQKTYRLLAKIYREQNSIDKIDQLINAISKVNMPRTVDLIQEITKIRNS